MIARMGSGTPIIQANAKIDFLAADMMVDLILRILKLKYTGILGFVTS